MARRIYEQPFGASDLTEEAILAIHRALERVIALGADVAVVRAPSGEVIDCVERPGPVSGLSTRSVIVRPLPEVLLGVLAHTPVDLERLEEIAMEIELLVSNRWMPIAEA